MPHLLRPEAHDSLVVIVEADEARQRESRKGSREWVRHQRDPDNHPAPAASKVAGLSAARRFGDSAAGGLLHFTKGLSSMCGRPLRCKRYFDISAYRSGAVMCPAC